MALTFDTGRLAQSGGERKSCSWTIGQSPSEVGLFRWQGSLREKSLRGQADGHRDEFVHLRPFFN
jgi:hypothetical protein